MESDLAKVAVRSCTTCSKAKAKCVRQVGKEICERCSRLKKECHSKEPTLKRRKPINTSRAAQLEKLENKIEHLVNALSTQQQQQQASSSRSDYGQLSPPTSQVSSERNVSRTNEVLGSLCRELTQEELEAIGRASNTTTTTVSSSRSTAVTLSEAESLLSRFHRLLSAGCPFVVLPDSITAQELYRTRPALLRAITTVTLFHDLPRQQLLVKDLIRDISERIMIKGEKSIDVLQAILVFVCWYHPHLFWCHQATNLLHLAIAMSSDLNIDKAIMPSVNFQAHSTGTANGSNLAHRTPNFEEHRIVLGLFFFTSMLSSSFNKCNVMQFTQHMEDCLTTLEQTREYDSDLFLVQMVRTQRLIDAINSTDTTHVSVKPHQKAFQADISRLHQLDHCKEDNKFLQLQYLTIEILIWELSLIELIEDRHKPLSQCLNNLFRCVDAIKKFLDVYFTIPSSAYLVVPFAVFGQFAHAFIVLTKLACLEVEGWDSAFLKERLDFGAVIDKAAKHFDGSVTSAPDGLLVNNDSFGKWAGRVRWMKSIWEAKFREEPVTGDALEGRQGNDRLAEELGQLPTPLDDISTDFFTYLDDNFWQLMSSFNGEMDWGGFPMEQTVM